MLSPAAARRLIAASADRQSARDRASELVATLTERESEVLACLGEGLSNAQIGARLYLSEATIKGYVSRTLDKLGCANRTQAGCSPTRPASAASPGGQAGSGSQREQLGWRPHRGTRSPTPVRRPGR